MCFFKNYEISMKTDRDTVKLKRATFWKRCITVNVNKVVLKLL